MNRRAPATLRPLSSVLLAAGALASCVLPELHKTEGSDGGAGAPDGSISAGGSTAGSAGVGGDGSGGSMAGQGGATGSGGRGGSGGSGTGGSGTGGSSTGGSTGGSGTGGTAAGGSAGAGGSGGSPACTPGFTDCTDCADNDGDALTDASDPDCIGPIDNDEGQFPLGIPGENVDPCRKDCGFDDNAGMGDDMCSWNLGCDPAGLPNCAYDPAIIGTSQCPDAQNQVCRNQCLPKVPNGCDCFGCCEVPAESNTYVFIGTPGCSFSSSSDDTVCPRCNPVADCFNPADVCELGIGSTTLPESCGGRQTCSAGFDPCGLAGQDLCSSGEYCLTGCCTPY